MSATFGAVCARVPAGGVPALEEAIREARSVTRSSGPLGVLAFDPALHRFAVVDRWGRQDNMPAWSEEPDLGRAPELAKLSQTVGEVVAFYEMDDGLTMGVYGAWKDGTLIRDLQWMNGSWMRVQGEPQPWEESAFSDRALREVLDCADEPDKEEIRSAYARNQIIVDTRWPRPFFNVCQACQAPPFTFMPWPRRSELTDRIRAEARRK
ncbi:MAG: hypothetical protein HY815_13035 [Candidatus Riflebacteria bacterium]|nr:hypothetical protein [Candidatus Riflebacteria bacterium]